MNVGTTFVTDSRARRGRYREAYVCTDHKALIDAGDPWYMEGRSVLMGPDIPPVLESWSARPSVTVEGFTLTLHVAGQIEPVDVFLAPTEARTLVRFINSATTADVR